MKSHHTHVGTPFRSIRHGHHTHEVEHPVPERAVEESLHAQAQQTRPLEGPPNEQRVNIEKPHNAEERVGLRGHDTVKR
jgi:hypothetical protein